VIEGYGSGYDRIIAACRDEGYPEPEWIENGPQIKVILRPHPNSSLSSQPTPATPERARRPARSRPTTDERHADVLAAIDELERPNARDIQEHTGIPRRTLSRDLGDLQARGLVEFVGTRRGGFYQRQK
jgi:predicted HTH transcriptional regulator